MNIELDSLLDRSRIEKKELQHLEHERVLLSREPASASRDHSLAKLDLRIEELDASRKILLHEIAKLTPGYAAALQYAIKDLGFDPAVGTVRFNKRRGGCYTFGMPGMATVAIWVENGSVVRSGPIDW